MEGGDLQAREQEALRAVSATAYYHSVRLPAASPWRDVCHETHCVFAEALDDAPALDLDMAVFADSMASAEVVPVPKGRGGHLRVIEGGQAQRPPATLEDMQPSEPAPAQPMQAAALTQAEDRRRRRLLKPTQVALGILAVIPLPHGMQRIDIWQDVAGYVLHAPWPLV
jgi:hypothetical protein